MALRAYIILTWIFLYAFYIAQALKITNVSNQVSVYGLSNGNVFNPMTNTSMFDCPRTWGCSCEFSNIDIRIAGCYFKGTVNFSSLFHFYPNKTHLEISHSYLSRFPCEVSSLTQLTTLNLSGNRIHSVPCDLTNLSHLRVIDLSYNSKDTFPSGIQEFPCELSSLSQLVSLDLSNNVIQSVRCNFSGMSSLTTLDLYNNPLMSFSCELATLTSVVYLNLSHNFIESVPCNLSTLTNLTFLDLSFQHIYTPQRVFFYGLSIFPCELATLPELTKLDLSDNQIESVACDLSTMDKLRSLDLSKNRFMSFPCNLTTISSHLSLNLSFNHLESMFCDFSKFTKLKPSDISGNGIQPLCDSTGRCTVPYEFSTLTHLTSLDLSHNWLQSVPCDISYLTNLTFLGLSWNKLKYMHCDLSNLTRLFTLHLQHNEFDSMLCQLSTVTELTSLNLQRNHIKSVPCDLSNLSHLTYLDISVNNLTAFPCELTSLPKLKTLKLQRNHIKSVPCDLSNLSHLIYLDISVNNLIAFPCELTTLPKLKTLDLSGNSMVSIPCDLSNMTEIKSIVLSRNSFHTFPCVLTNLNKLSSVDVSLNRIKSKPCNWSMLCDLSNFTKLKTLDISDNGIDPLNDTTGRCTFPCEFSTLAHLTSLDLSSNRLECVPCDISYQTNLNFLGLSWNKLKYMHCDLSNLTQLTTLDLQHNKFESMPCELSTVTELTSLDLRWNRIKSVPCDLSNLSHLTYLDISANFLTAFPCGLSTLPKLKTLDLSVNSMVSIPCDLSNMTEIKSIVLSFNSFHTFPCALTNLSKLSSLDVSSNRITSIPCDWSNMTYLTSIELDFNQISVLDSWPIMLAKASLHKLSLFANHLTQFTNYAGTSGVSCKAIHHPFSMSLNFNNITHIMNIVKGWNLKMTTKEELYNCLDFIVPQTQWNPLTCDCVDYDVYRYLQNRSISVRNLIKCHYPPKFKGMNPAYISLDQFVCDISENCPSGCTCTNSPFYQNISVNCEYTEFITLPDNVTELPNEDYGYSLQFINGHLRNISYTPYLRNVKTANFGNNSISKISMEALVALQNVSLLHIDHNALQRLPGNITNIHFKGGIDLKLGDNPWICDCTTMDIRSWMKDHEAVITDKLLVTCHSPPHMLNKKMLYTHDSIFCPKNNVQINNYLIGLVVLSTSITLICIFSLIAIKIRRWVVNGRLAGQMALLDEVDAEREFDVFVSYACEEEDYILDDFIPQLENHNFKVCCHRIHFLAGNTIIDNISECINHSKRTLVYFTNSYKNSRFCMWEFKEVLNKDIRDGTIRLITVKDTDLDITDLDDSTRAFFERRTYLEFNAPRFWENLIRSLPRRVANLEEFEMQ